MRPSIVRALIAVACAASATLPAAAPTFAQATPPGTGGQPGLTPSEKNAVSRLEKEGYSDITDVKVSPKGVSAKAIKDGRSVSVVVEPAGRIMELQPDR